jgi:ribosomal protein L35AE/L33A
MVIDDVAVTEGNSGQVVAKFTVSLSGPSGKVISVKYATSNSTAVATADYATSSGTLNFPVGTTSQSVTVLVNADLLDEINETFFVNLSSATNAAITDNLGVGTIIDDDPMPSLSINNVSFFEGNSGYTLATFTVTLSAASGRTVSVGYATADIVGVSSSDYASKSGVLSFAPGIVSKTISILVKGDLLKELDEFFSLNLSDALNASIADSHGVARIQNDD